MTTTSHSRTAHVKPPRKERFTAAGIKSIFYQCAVVGVVALMGWYLYDNVSRNLQNLGLASGFGFLDIEAPFDISWSVVPYEPGDSYARVYVIGITNTLIVAAMAIAASTGLGFLIGIARLSRNWLISRLASVYVEVVRNTPALIQVLFWFLAVFSILPRPKDGVDVAGLGILQVNNRGIYFPRALPQDGFNVTLLAIAIAVVAAIVLGIWARRRRILTGQRFPVALVMPAILVLFPATVFVLTGAPLNWEIPVLKGFNLTGGISFPPAMCAVVLSLSIYHAAYIGEAVRAGIMSVSPGQGEAAFSLGIKSSWSMRMIVLPQALRAIVPQLISNWMNAVKNTSLAVAIGFPDLVALFLQTSLNQVGYAVEIVAMVMIFYCSVSITISLLLNYYNKRVQLKER
ncbi:amino acid ABC transporter permease [Phaeobacter inhibens]|uniref:Putative general L-amino acid transport system permease protein AapQ n=1 Tax=Phaeobacter inhibens TaxID=221822 RepID=A0A2I7KBB6_9RHOB|nr:ABC transporter permease subunit [Phaeobacter inhibens]AUQ99897.1 putative general L-amino acid transport system permease protein AapQ [Phaeobacter inhibens]UWR75312.1 ABC transporter permease subunit [Phaeobacter inhibens]